CRDLAPVFRSSPRNRPGRSCDAPLGFGLVDLMLEEVPDRLPDVTDVADHLTANMRAAVDQLADDRAHVGLREARRAGAGLEIADVVHLLGERVPRLRAERPGVGSVLPVL